MRKPVILLFRFGSLGFSEQKVRQLLNPYLAVHNYEISDVVVGRQESEYVFTGGDVPQFADVDFDPIRGKYIMQANADLVLFFQNNKEDLKSKSLNNVLKNRLRPMHLRTYVTQALQRNIHNREIWGSLSKRRCLRTAFTPKQAAELLALSSRWVISSDLLDFFFSKELDCEAFIRTLFKPKFDPFKKSMIPISKDEVNSGVRIVLRLRDYINLTNDQINACISSVIDKNIDLWAKQGVTMHEAVDIVTNAAV